MRRCEDEKMFYRPPLLEEPCAQTLSGKMLRKLMINTEIFGAHHLTKRLVCKTMFCRLRVTGKIITMRLLPWNVGYFLFLII